MKLFSTLAILLLFSATSSLFAADAPYRTDAGGDEKLPWYQLKVHEFPPEGSGHAISGELIGVDHINRTGIIRLDRSDAIRRGDWDHELPFKMLPYGSISYHGAPAEMRDIPIGTHLHGQFYVEEKVPKNAEGTFDRAIRMEDDFSYSVGKNRVWRVDAVDLEKSTLTVTSIGPGEEKPDPKPTIYQLAPSTQVFKGRGIASLADLAAGQKILLNATVCTLKGPGRITDIWIDAESRAVATEHQLQVHRQFMHEHGLACWIDEVDNEKGIVTVTVFSGFDPKLMEDFTPAIGLSAAVSEENLRTYDQISDRMRGDILEVQSIPAGAGNSGIRIKFKPGNLLEGFRPKRYLRIFSGKYKVDDLPREERIYQ